MAEIAQQEFEESNMHYAFSELYEVLTHLEEENRAKVPASVLDFIYDNRDPNYETNIDHSIDIKDQPLLYETDVLLSLIYTNYLCSEEEKTEIIKKDAAELGVSESSLRDEYNNMFQGSVLV